MALEILWILTIDIFFPGSQEKAPVLQPPMSLMEKGRREHMKEDEQNSEKGEI